MFPQEIADEFLAMVKEDRLAGLFAGTSRPRKGRLPAWAPIAKPGFVTQTKLLSDAASRNNQAGFPQLRGFLIWAETAHPDLARQIYHVRSPSGKITVRIIPQQLATFFLEKVKDPYSMQKFFRELERARDEDYRRRKRKVRQPKQLQAKPKTARPTRVKSTRTRQSKTTQKATHVAKPKATPKVRPKMAARPPQSQRLTFRDLGSKFSSPSVLTNRLDHALRSSFGNLIPFDVTRALGITGEKVEQLVRTGQLQRDNKRLITKQSLRQFIKDVLIIQP